MDDQTYYLQPMSGGQSTAGGYAGQGISAYSSQNSHQLPLSYHPGTTSAAAAAAAYAGQLSNAHLMEQQQQNYHQAAAAHYSGQLHHGYHHPSTDPYMQHSYQAAYDNNGGDHSSQLTGLPAYYNPAAAAAAASNNNNNGGALTTEPSSNTTGLSSVTQYGSYSSAAAATAAAASGIQQPGGSSSSSSSSGHYQQHGLIDPTNPQSAAAVAAAAAAAAAYGQYSHPHQVPPMLDSASYMGFGQTGQNAAAAAAFGHGYMPYGLFPQGIIDGSLSANPQMRVQSNSISKNKNIKSEDSNIEHDLQLMGSIGDSHSQNEDKLKQVGSGYMLHSGGGGYESSPQQIMHSSSQQQQQQHQYAAYQQQYGIKKDSELMYTNSYFPGYQPSYSQHQQHQQQAYLGQSPQQQQIIAFAAANAQLMKDKEDSSKKQQQQPISPGRKKAIKKSLTTEPSSPESPRRVVKRKNTLKSGEIHAESSSPLNAPGLTKQQSGSQFNLHLLKVPSNNDHQQMLMHKGQPPAYYQGMMIDPKTQQIAGLDSTSLSRFKDLPHDFNMNDLAAVYDDKQIGTISKEERKLKIQNYQEKRKRRIWQKKISYDVRKKVADGRLRVKGRFVTKRQAMQMLSLNGREQDFTMDQLKDMLRQRGILQPACGGGGDDDSKSPTLSAKNKGKAEENSLLKRQRSDEDQEDEEEEEEEDDEYDFNQVHSEELPPIPLTSSPIVLHRGQSCSNIGGGGVGAGKKLSAITSMPIIPSSSSSTSSNNLTNFSSFDGKIYRSLLSADTIAVQTTTTTASAGGQLLLKLEQKDYEGKQQQATTVMTVGGTPPLQGDPSSGSSPIGTMRLSQLNKNQSTYAGSENSTSSPSLLLSPQHEQQGNGGDNLLSQEVTDQLGNLNIMSPQMKQQQQNKKLNSSLINLTDSATGLPVINHHHQHYAFSPEHVQQQLYSQQQTYEHGGQQQINYQNTQQQQQEDTESSAMPIEHSVQ